MAVARGGRVEDCEHVALLLLACDRNGSPELAAAAERMLSAADPLLWRNLDLAARRTWWYDPVWAEAARQRVPVGDAGTLGLVVASFHPSGHVREAAAARLGEIEGDIALRALALRAADWVSQVRDRARVALEYRMSSAEALLGAGPLAVTLAGRAQGRWLRQRLKQAIEALDDTGLAMLCAAADWRVRRAAYDVALRSHRLGQAQLLEAAERDSDLVVRVRCADAAILRSGDGRDG